MAFWDRWRSKTPDALVHELTALARSKGQDSVGSLVTALADPEDVVRAAAAKLLEDMGWIAGNDRERALFCVARHEWSRLPELGEPALQVLLGPVFSATSSTGYARPEIAGVIGMILSSGRVTNPVLVAGAVGVLQGVSGSDDSELRQCAVKALGESVGVLSGQAVAGMAMRTLVARLADSTLGVRDAAADALDAFHWRPTSAVERAYWAITRHQSAGFADTIWELLDLGADAVEPICTALLQSSESFERISAAVNLAAILKDLGSRPADHEARRRGVAGLAMGLKDPDDYVCHLTAFAIKAAGVRDRQFVMPLEALRDRAGTVSGKTAIEVLAWLQEG